MENISVDNLNLPETPNSTTEQLLELQSSNIIESNVLERLIESGISINKLSKIQYQSDTSDMIKPISIQSHNIDISYQLYGESKSYYDAKIKLYFIIQQILKSVVTDEYIYMITIAMMEKAKFGLIYPLEIENTIKIINHKIQKYLDNEKV
uniref:Uncharacterized protein n=1 Tax=Pithovirus LCPAC102 TaxID=2506587 RepID=A0A4D5XFF5_9VIRU|nr:MAG: hypothetical protein LCPAC102_01440 [Pithovirus LCPAC102]